MASAPATAIQSQMGPIYGYGYPAYPGPYDAPMDPESVIPRHSRRRSHSHRHHPHRDHDHRHSSRRRRSHHRHRSHRRSPSPSSTGSGSSLSGGSTESPLSSPHSFDSADFGRDRRRRRSSSGYNAFPRPRTRDRTMSVSFWPYDTEIPSPPYDQWDQGGAIRSRRNSMMIPQPQPQPQIAMPMYSLSGERRGSMMTIANAQTAPPLVLGTATAAPMQQTISPYAGTPMYAPTPQPTPFAPQGQSVMPAASSFSMPSQTMPMPMPSSVMQGSFAQTSMAQAPPATSSLQLTNMTPSPSPSFGPPSGTVPRQVLRFGSDLYGQYAGLLYHSPQPVRYDGEEYPTALHLFEARKFLDHRPEIAHRIRVCERFDEALRISAEMKARTRPDWGNAVALGVVSNLFSLSLSPPTLANRLVDCGWVGGLGIRWTRYCTASSASTTVCARNSSARTRPSSSMSSRPTPTGEMAGAWAGTSSASHSCACAIGCTARRTCQGERLRSFFSLRPQDERNAPLRDIFWGSFLAIFFGVSPSPAKNYCSCVVGRSFSF